MSLKDRVTLLENEAEALKAEVSALKFCSRCGEEKENNHGWCLKCLTEYKKRSYRKNKADWRAYFMGKYGSILCECCGKELKYNEITWDHINERPNIKPSKWVQSHTCNDVNKVTWESFHLGLLCQPCNNRAGHWKDRTRYLKLLLKYSKGKDHDNNRGSRWKREKLSSKATGSTLQN